MLFLLDSFKCKVDFDLECKSNNVIYVARCYLWYLGNSIQFHFGQTCNRFHVRLNGHRACFKTDNLAFEKSALSMCNMIDHPSQFGDKFSYFNFGNIKQVASRNRDRAEDFFIFNCRSDIFFAFTVINFSNIGLTPSHYKLALWCLFCSPDGIAISRAVTTSPGMAMI